MVHHEFILVGWTFVETFSVILVTEVGPLITLFSPDSSLYIVVVVTVLVVCILSITEMSILEPIAKSANFFEKSLDTQKAL